jgi:flagellar motor switch protein FliM
VAEEPAPPSPDDIAVAVSSDAAPFGFRVGLCFDRSVAFALVETSLGGTEVSQAPDRPLSRIEVGIVHHVANQLMAGYAACWAPLARLETARSELLPEDQVRGLSGRDGVCTARFEVSVGEATGTICVLLPLPDADPLLHELNLERWLCGEDADRDTSGLGRLLRGSHLPVSAVLGSIPAKVGDIASVAPGDVLLLPGIEDDSCLLRVGDHLKFSGAACQDHGRLVVSITSVLNGIDHSNRETK